MQSSLKTRATSSNDPVSSSALIPAPATRAQIAVGPACSNCIPEPTATRSAAMLSAFATISSPTRPITTLRALPASRSVASSPNPFPVASAVRSQAVVTSPLFDDPIQLEYLDGTHDFDKPRHVLVEWART